MEQTIRFVSDVKQVSELLGGASVDAVRLSPSGARMRLEVELTRSCPELQPAARRGFLSRPRIPWVKSRLTLEGIAEVTMQRADGAPAPAPLLSCDAVPGGYTLVVTSHDGLRMSLGVEQLSGWCADVGKPIETP